MVAKKTDELWVCSECGTDFKDEEDYLEHLELYTNLFYGEK